MSYSAVPLDQVAKAKTAVIEEINKPFADKTGYKIKNGHFEIGRSLHCETYYFIKKFFQSRKNCQDIATILQTTLQQKFKKYPSTTLIGFGNYCGFPLSLVCEHDNHYNYAILENDGDSFAFQSTPHLASDIIIILPVACTCSIYFKLKRYIDNYVNEHHTGSLIINKSFITCFLVVDEQITAGLTDCLMEIESLQAATETKKLYDAYGWLRISDDTVEFAGATSYSLIQLKSKLYLPEVCPNCFPELSKEESPREKYLFSTSAHHEAPGLIFNLPNAKDQHPQERSFKEAMAFKANGNNPHLFGNIVSNNNSHINFVHGNIFYNNNKTEILAFFNAKLSAKLNNIHQIVFITANTKRCSTFLEDIVNGPALKGKEIIILRYDPVNEFVNNFISIYSNIFTETSAIIYFEDVLSGGRRFKLFSDYIKHLKKESAFHLLLTLIDRTSNFTKDEILQKLSCGTNNHGDLIAYFKLNVPVIGAPHLGDPLKEKYELLIKLTNECHLDALKLTLGKTLQHNKPKTIREQEELREDPNERFYIPMQEDNNATYLFYQRFFTRQQLNYVKLFLTHEINNVLARTENATSYPSKLQRIFDKVKNPIDEILLDKPGEYEDIRIPSFEQDFIKDVILGILSKPPFTYYEEIYREVFAYSIHELQNHDRKDKNTAEKKIDSGEFIKLKRLIRRSIKLNSNYILSHNFLSNIKKDYALTNISDILKIYKDKYLKLPDNEDEYNIIMKFNLEYKYRQLVSYNYFLLSCFKTLIFRNPGRSIRLEHLLNSAELQPDDIGTGQKNVSDEDALKILWRSPYYLFNRIVKAENIFLLNELKEFHKQQIKLYNPKKNKDGLYLIYSKEVKISSLNAYYFKHKKNNSIINNARRLISESTSKRSPKQEANTHEQPKNSQKLLKDYYNIRHSVCAMLKVINVLELGANNNTEEEHHERIREGKLNKEIRTILDAVLEILKPGIDNGELKYAFFIEYRESQRNASNVYPVMSISGNDSDYDHLTIELDKAGLIYNMLYGMTETIDGYNPQTLLFAGRLSDGSIHSFQEKYFKDDQDKTPYLQIRTDEQLNGRSLPFGEMFKKDEWDGKAKTGLKMLSNSNMTLIFRLSNLIPPNQLENDYKIKGEAVLVITNTAPTTRQNFLEFMNIEKIRLLLLIKEELLAYLQKQFDYDSFIEALENRKQIIYRRKLEHGLNGYLETQDIFFSQAIKNWQGEEKNKTKTLYNIVKRAIQGQIMFKSKNDEPLNPYPCSEILEKMGYIFECKHLGGGAISFKKIKQKGFNTTDTIYMHPSVLEVVIPEIIINVKKCSSRLVDDGITISYNQDTKRLTFENDIRDGFLNRNQSKEFGGLEMCKQIMAKLKYEPLITKPEDNNKFVTIINLNLKQNAH